MHRSPRPTAALYRLLSAGMLCLAIGSAAAAGAQGYIVQGADLSSAKAAVLQAGGQVTHELGVIRAVGAQLTPQQLDALRAAAPELRIRADRPVATHPGAD